MEITQQKLLKIETRGAMSLQGTIQTWVDKQQKQQVSNEIQYVNNLFVLTTNTRDVNQDEARVVCSMRIALDFAYSNAR